MKYVYEGIFEIRLRSIIKDVADFEDKINKNLEDFGCSEKIYSSAKCFTATITTEKELTEEEIYKTSAILKAQVIESMPKYDIRLKSFSRKSEQSVLQSVV